ncbi:MAG: rubrerythrin family protein [Thermoleophilia bacterium]
MKPGIDLKLRRRLLQAYAYEQSLLGRLELYALRAEGFGYPEIARLFRALARGKRVQARRQLKAAGETPGLERSLMRVRRLLAWAERKIYGGAEEAAIRRGDRRAEMAFRYPRTATVYFEALLAEAQAAVGAGTDLPLRDYWLCRVCGYVETGETPPEGCPVCGSPAKAFYRT